MHTDLILSIDVTHEFGSLALLAGEEVLEEMLLHSREGFGHILYGHLERLFSRHGVDVGQVACFAAANGPGTFTGVRVGLAAIKGLAEAVGRPVVAVSNLRAMSTFGSAPCRAVLLDARRGEIYGGLYDARATAVSPEAVMRFPAWLATLPDADLEFLAMDFTPFAAALDASRLAAAPRTTVPRALAAAAGRIAYAEFLAGLAQDPAAIDANYVRRSDAELLWKE